MKSKALLIIVLFLLSPYYCRIYAQSSNSDLPVDFENKNFGSDNGANWQTTNFFEYGDSVIAAEDNFRNLFANWSNLIWFGNDNVQLLSYRYVGVVKNARQVKKCLKKTFYSNAPAWSWGVSYSTENGVPKSKSRVEKISLHSMPLVESKVTLNARIDNIAQNIVNEGDKIYAIKYLFDGKTFEHFVFVNPATGKVNLKGNIFGLEFRVYTGKIE